MLFVTKDRSLCVPLLEGLLKYWPFANRLKETLFLAELYEVIEICNPEKIKHLIPRLFKRVVRCVCSDDVQVADRSLYLFENHNFIQILRIYKDITFPIIIPSISDLGKNHWLPSMEQTFIALRLIVRECDINEYYKALES